MKKFILAIAMSASALTAVPAIAQSRGEINREYNRDLRDARQDYRRDTRDERREYREARQEARRDAWRDYRRYDYNRPGPQGRYYADNYYRDGRYYRPVRLTRNDRIYRGNDNRYYCRRSDGTTGLIIGGIAGGLIGNSIDRGGSGILGTILGAGAGAAIGNSIDRGQVVCR
jgi:hypothetical protein